MVSDINKYIEGDNGDIYKIIDSHFLKLSPCDPARKYFNELDTSSYHYISYNNACMIINKQYNALAEEWHYEGNNYIARVLDIKTKDDMEVHTVNIRLLPDHSVVIDQEGPSMLKLIRHKGKMYYIMIINERLPRVKAYDLFGNFCQWVGIQNCKPVWNETESCFM